MSRLVYADNDSSSDRSVASIERPTRAGSSLDDSLRANLLRQFGDFTLAYSTCFQKELLHFVHGQGYIAYAQRGGYTFVLGDPIVEDEHREELIKRFIAKFPNAAFVQVGFETAAILDEIGYRINGLGVDTTLDLDSYSFYGKTKERFRYAHNWLKRRGYKTIESSFAEIDCDAVRRLSDSWRSTRTVRDREVCFLNRPMVYTDEPDTRKFFLLDADDRMLVYVGLDPIYRKGRLIGYATTFKRRDPEAPSYAEQGLMKVLIEQLIEEGYDELKLGLSPLAYVEPHSFRVNPFLRWSWNFAFKAGWVNRYFYNLRGHAEYKRRFGGREEQTYFAAKGISQDLRLFTLLRLCRIL